MRSATPAWFTAAIVSPPPITENAEPPTTARATPTRAGGEGRLLEHTHGPVPHDRPGRPQRDRELLDAGRADVQAHLVGRNLPDGHRAPRGAVETGGDHRIDRQHDLHAATAGRLQRGPGRLDAIRLDERFADIVPERAQEREGHAAADQQGVDLAEQVLHHA